MTAAATDFHEDLSFRAEAQSVALSELTKHQYEAFASLTTFLHDAHEQVNPTDGGEPVPPERGPWRPTGTRRSRVLFIDGDRGTGKTSMLLSLMAESHHAHAPNGRFRLDDSRKQTQALLRESRVIWLRPHEAWQ